MVVGGGGSSSTPVDPMTQKDAIVIAGELPSGMCGDSSFQSYIRSEMSAVGAYSFLFRTESNSVTCATYGKRDEVNDTGGCMVEYFSSGDETCVIGFNLNTSATQYTNTLNKEDIGRVIQGY